MDFLKEIVKEIGNEYTQLASDIDETEKYVDNNPVGMKPNWRDWGGKLEQEIHCLRRKVKGEVHFVAELVGSRTNGNLVGTNWTIREGNPPNIVWNGIPELREGKI